MIDTEDKLLSLLLIEMFTLSNDNNADIHVQRIIFADKCDYMQSERHLCLCHDTISMTAAGDYRSIA